jgi:hypothetical protein
MALLAPGVDEPRLKRAQIIIGQLNGIPGAGGSVASATRAGYGLLEVLLSQRRWKKEAVSVEALQRDIKGAFDRVRVAVEAALPSSTPRS